MDEALAGLGPLDPPLPTWAKLLVWAVAEPTLGTTIEPERAVYIVNTILL